jgi:cyclase
VGSLPPVDPQAAERLDGLELTHARVRRLGERTLMVATEPVGSANAGIVLGDERVLVVDTRVTPSFGAELADAIVGATGARLEDLLVVNTHFHGDHVFGNGAFAGATILATASTQAAQRREWERQVATFAQLRPQQADEIAAGERVFATVGLLGAARVDLGGVEVVLEPVGPAHTDGDLTVTVGADGVAFIADLVFNGHWPSMWNADLLGWLGALSRLRGGAPATLVPGHGDAGGPEVLDAMAACLRFLVELELEDPADEDAAIAASPFADHLHRVRVAEGRRRVREQRSPALARVAGVPA